ncbi:hypothetical protein LMH87_005362 [Akanthomyces muscarius]|uniref:Uncharacterized protein n=1 Tax=Akanthomyces muscarius TaxID=2231603 RepID=A0A9W8QLM7_AKAMU|nr:hypothetical protein LMH87_005362 [Akanthomyces muscarius]KAJ4163648.1 hypothetical protein LMH87_005362 [Akanthomyces muscarius]
MPTISMTAQLYRSLLTSIPLRRWRRAIPRAMELSLVYQLQRRQKRHRALIHWPQAQAKGNEKSAQDNNVPL